jgi:hypothetical protein
MEEMKSCTPKEQDTIRESAAGAWSAFDVTNFCCPKCRKAKGFTGFHITVANCHSLKLHNWVQARITHPLLYV